MTALIMGNNNDVWFVTAKVPELKYIYFLASVLHLILVHMSTPACGNQGSVSTLASLLPIPFMSLTPHTSAPSDQVFLFSHTTHNCRLGSLLLLNCCRQLPSGFRMNVASCFPFSHYFSLFLTTSIFVFLSPCQICASCSGLSVMVKLLYG